MLKVLFHRSFQRAYKKVVQPGSRRHRTFKAKLELFIADPFHPSLRTHKLHGSLAGYWSFTIEYDLRVIFYFEDPETAILFDLGTHDEVY
jgi:addiction module RelE/StbE family toxin